MYTHFQGDGNLEQVQRTRMVKLHKVSEIFTSHDNFAQVMPTLHPSGEHLHGSCQLSTSHENFAQIYASIASVMRTLHRKCELCTGLAN